MKPNRPNTDLQHDWQKQIDLSHIDKETLHPVPAIPALTPAEKRARKKAQRRADIERIKADQERKEKAIRLASKLEAEAILAEHTLHLEAVLEQYNAWTADKDS